MIPRTPKAVEALMKIEKAFDESESSKSDENENLQRLKMAREDASLAEREVEAGFPILHAWAVVGLWALLEATNRNFLTEWLKHKRTAWRAEPFKQLRIRLGEYESIPRNQRHNFIVEQLERHISASLKDGVTRFEALLEPFGLSGEIPAELRRQMFEFSQVRNLIAHNSGKVDRRFSEACPWLKVKVGDDFLVSAKMYSRYHLASMRYVIILICRVGETYGVDMSKVRASVTQSFEA